MRSGAPTMHRPPLSPRTPFSRAAALVAQRLDLIDGIQPQGPTQGHMCHFGLSNPDPEKQRDESSSGPVADTAASSKPTKVELPPIRSRSASTGDCYTEDSSTGVSAHGGSIMAVELS